MNGSVDLVVDDATSWAERDALAGHARQAVILRGPDIGADLHGLADAGHGLLLEVGRDPGLVRKARVCRSEQKNGRESSAGAGHWRSLQAGPPAVHRSSGIISAPLVEA